MGRGISPWKKTWRREVGERTVWDGGCLQAFVWGSRDSRCTKHITGYLTGGIVRLQGKIVKGVTIFGRGYKGWEEYSYICTNTHNFFHFSKWKKLIKR